MPLAASHVPALLDVPYALADAVGEALRSGRADLVPVLMEPGRGRRPGRRRAELGARRGGRCRSSAVHSESRGRLRILAAEVSERATASVGVVSWVLLKDGWHSLTPHHDDGARVAVARVDPDDLATELAPVLAQVSLGQDGIAMSGLDIPRTHGSRRPEESSASVAADKYDQMLALADLFDSSGNEMRTRARLGAEILGDDDVVDSGELSKATWGQAEEDIRAATTGKHGLLTRSVELDADALVVRATVLTYRWIDELQQAAYKTLGSIAGRAIGYLAPEVALGGAIVSAGLIETDSLDRDGVTAYLSELAENNPDLMDHLSGGGGLLDGLHMRSLLTAGVLASDQGAHAARGGLRAIGVEPFPTDAVVRLPRLRRVLRGGRGARRRRPARGTGQAPRSLEELMANLSPRTAGSASSGSAPAATSPTCPAPSASSPAGCASSAPTRRRRQPGDPRDREGRDRGRRPRHAGGLGRRRHGRCRDRRRRARRASSSTRWSPPARPSAQVPLHPRGHPRAVAGGPQPTPWPCSAR